MQVPYLANVDQSWQSYRQKEKKHMKKEVQCFQCVTLLERKPAKISRKTIKWATKLVIIKKKSNRKKKRARKKNRNRLLISQILAYMYSYGRKTKMVLNYIQFAENYVLGVGNLFLSHANWPRNGSNRRIWSKIRFFLIKLHWLTAKDHSLAVSKLS